MDDAFVDVPSDAPRVHVDRVVCPHQPGGGAAGSVELDDDRARVWTADGSITVDRATMTVTITSETPLDDRIVVHPYLAFPMSVVSHWLGRQSFHAGAFVWDGVLYGVAGTKGAGKSSTLAWLAGRGAPVVTDDLLVLDDLTAFAGPRCVDLREDAGPRLGGTDLAQPGPRSRWRITAAAVPSEHRLGGMLYLAWGDGIAVDRLDLDDRLAHLYAHRVIRRGTADAEAFLDLATLPAWRFTRPRELDQIDDAGAQLLRALDDAGG